MRVGTRIQRAGLVVERPVSTASWDEEHLNLGMHFSKHKYLLNYSIYLLPQDARPYHRMSHNMPCLRLSLYFSPSLSQRFHHQTRIRHILAAHLLVVGYVPQLRGPVQGEKKKRPPLRDDRGQPDPGATGVTVGSPGRNGMWISISIFDSSNELALPGRGI